MLLASPLTSLLAGTLLFYFHVNVNRWLEDREAKRARGILDEALDDDHVPDDVKDDFRQLLAGHHRDRIMRELERVTAVGDVPKRPPTDRVQES